MAKKPAANARKGRGRPAKEAEADEAAPEMEGEEGTQAAAKPAMGLETALIALTFVALVAAFLMVQMKMHAVVGKGWPI